ncbi:LysR family transcriptional regulator [Dactylosporangium sp. CS-033363]|uniref:LysR family transcriptional regulator n=1 Tax=Dactylosporangium sp. CS-033363 TaxID=3239935 RepID=UPI003D8DC3AB
MEIRDIEIFLTLAEELHFGRTAQRLHVSPARVSQAIKAQERRIGGALFERTSRAVALTPLGRQLRTDLQAGYDAIRGGLDRATETARGIAGTVRLGVMGAVGYELQDVIDRFTKRWPACDVLQREIYFSDPFTDLRTGAVDLALVWRPVREPDLVEGPVMMVEGSLLAVWDTHELAGRSSVSVEDFADRLFVDPGPRAPGYWMDAILPRTTPAGRPVPRGPRADTFHELLHAVSTRQALAPVHEHYLRYYAHPGLTLLPVQDAPPAEWVLTWMAGPLPARSRAFVEVASARGARRLGET